MEMSLGIRRGTGGLYQEGKTHRESQLRQQVRSLWTVHMICYGWKVLLSVRHMFASERPCGDTLEQP